MLNVENLSISFRTDEGVVSPVRKVSFSVEKGRTLGLVGESGSGKSVSTKALMHLLPRNANLSAETRIHYQAKSGESIAIHDIPRNSRQLHHLRGGEIGMIFQEPMASFSPVYTIGNQIIEAIRLHRGLKGRAAKEYAIEMLDKVGIVNPHIRVDQYPHEMSGGMRQRAMIALALSAGPALLIADEPTTALDVTIQAQVLELMKKLQDELDMGMIFITHDLGVIAQIADDVAVMYQGEIVERGSVREVINNPQNAYTQRLLDAVPNLDKVDPPVLLPKVGEEDRLLTVDNLSVHFPIETRRLFRKDVTMFPAVEDISFDIRRGETVGLVGESGSGKTTVGRAILRAIDPTSGQVTYHPPKNEDAPDLQGPVAVHQLSGEALRTFRPQMSLVFQDPYSSLNPRMTVRDIIAEPLIVSGQIKDRKLIDERVRAIAERCKLDLEHLRRFPHAFSGGQRQRICIARALVSLPNFVVCDESVSALDVSIQAEIVTLLKEIQDEMGVSFLFIAHDLAVVAQISHRVAVLYQGRFVEYGPTKELFFAPRHPYTRALLSAIPHPDPDARFEPVRFEGDLEHPVVDRIGTGYQIIGSIAESECREAQPGLIELEPGHFVACYLAEELDFACGVREVAE